MATISNNFFFYHKHFYGKCISRNFEKKIIINLQRFKSLYSSIQQIFIMFQELGTRDIAVNKRKSNPNPHRVFILVKGEKINNVESIPYDDEYYGEKLKQEGGTDLPHS